MSHTLVSSLVALLPVSVLFCGSALFFRRTKAASSLLQLLGTGLLLVVVIAHISEALHLFPWMGWGLERSIGHYLDLCSAVLGATLFSIGYLLQSLGKVHQ
jgi:hypothetical protein